MRAKFLIAGSSILVIGLVLSVGKEKVIESVLQAPVLGSEAKALRSAKRTVQEAQKILQKNEVKEVTKEDLRAQIEEINQFMENANVFERLRDEGLDPETREEFLRVLDTKQDLLAELVRQEIRTSDEILAGVK